MTYLTMVRRARGARFALRGTGVGVALLALGCGSSPGTGSAGELGQGTFEYLCVTDGDIKCGGADNLDVFDATDLGGEGRIPRAVAVGSLFGLDYGGRVREDGDELLVTVRAASLQDEVDTEVFSVRSPAEAAFVAEDSRGRAIDFIVLEAHEATELTLWSGEIMRSEITLEQEESIELTVAPRSDEEVLLAGALPYVWTTTNEDVFSFEGGKDEVRNEGSVTLVAHAAGTAEVRVFSGRLGQRLVVEVKP